MTATAAKAPFEAPDDARERAASLIAANINPATGLATDYLNHFNEAIMLLEMVPDIPECAEDFLAWQPKSYREHFSGSSFSGRDLAISAYEGANAAIRAEFDRLTDSMTSILTSVAMAMRDSSRDEVRIRLASHAIDWVKPLVAQAGGVINGAHNSADVDTIMSL